MTKEQQDKKDTNELGMLSIMQMHSDETGTEVAKNWKDTFTDIYTFNQQEYLKSTNSEMIETEQENKEITEDIEFDDDNEDSDENDSDYVETNKCRNKYSIFDDEEESDDLGTQNTLGKESGHGKIVIGRMGIVRDYWIDIDWNLPPVHFYKTYTHLIHLCYEK